MKEQDLAVQRMAQQTRRGISWNLVGALSTNGLRIAVIAILGRALTDSDFGVVAAALSVNGILNAIRDVGLGPALVQRPQLSSAHLRTAFAVSNFLGITLALGLALTGPGIAALLGIEESANVIRALGLLFLIRGLSAVSRAVCQREMRFRAIAVIDAGAFAFGSMVSIVGALAGWGPWALVWGYLAEEIASTAAFLWLAPPSLALWVDGAAFTDLMSFGAGQTLGQVAGILATYGDNMIVGHVLGPGPLGSYTRAYDLIKFPSTVFASVVGSVLFPALSRLQHKPAELGEAFRRTTFLNALVLLPASAATWVLAPEIIALLLGPGWNDVVMPFQILSATMFLRTSQKLGATVAHSAGRVGQVAFAYALYLVLVVGGGAASVRYGLPGVALSTAVAITVVGLHCSWLAAKVGQLPLGSYIRAHGEGAAIAVAIGALLVLLSSALRGLQLAPSLVLAFCATAAGITMLVGVVLLRARPDVLWLRSLLRRSSSKVDASGR